MIWLLKPNALISPMRKNPWISVRLDFERDVLAAGETEDHAAADEQHRQRGDEGGHLEDGDEKPIDQADGQAEREARRTTAVQTPRSK